MDDRHDAHQASDQPRRREQLELIDAPRQPWRLDERTRRRGLQGVAEAREALRQARARAHQSAA